MRAVQFLTSQELSPPNEVILQMARDLAPSSVNTSLKRLRELNSAAGIAARQRAAFDEMTESFAVTYQLTVPTDEELAEADEALRTRILPETSEEELQQAASRMASGPEKVELAAYLANLLQRATGLPAPWAVFVVVFCIAVTMNPDVVCALALAFAMPAVIQGMGNKPDK